MSDRFETLWAAYLEGELDGPGLDELDALLESDPSLLDLSVELYQEHRLLGLALQPGSAGAFARETATRIRGDREAFVGKLKARLLDAGAGPSREPRACRRLARGWLGYAAVALVTLSVSLTAQWRFWRPPGGEPGRATATGPSEHLGILPSYVATLLRSHGCRWEDGAEAPREGQRLTPGRLRLREGVAVVRFDGGASAILDGVCDFEVKTAGSARVLAGSVALRAPEEAAGFVLQTPASDLVDLGTEFSVRVEPTGATEVHVQDGEVQWQATAGPGRTDRILREGHALRFDDPGDPSTRPIPPSPRRFADLLPADRGGASPRELLAYEGFSYDVERSPTPERRADGGIGWDGPWYRGWPASTLDLNFDPARSLVGPPALDAPAGGCLELPVDITLTSKFTQANKRRLATPIDLGRQGIYYLSFLVRKSPGPARSDDGLFHFALKASADHRMIAGFGILSDGRLLVMNRGNNATTSSAVVRPGTTYLLVGKVVAGVDRPDQLLLKAFGPDAEVDPIETGDWDVEGLAVDHDLVLDQIHIYSTPDCPCLVDEIRFGTSWAAVTPLRPAPPASARVDLVSKEIRP